jgi:hypothetical protein
MHSKQRGEPSRQVFDAAWWAGAGRGWMPSWRCVCGCWPKWAGGGRRLDGARESKIKRHCDTSLQLSNFLKYFYYSFIKHWCKFWGSLSQPSEVLRANPMVASRESSTHQRTRCNHWKRDFLCVHLRYKLPQFGGAQFKSNVRYVQGDSQQLSGRDRTTYYYLPTRRLSARDPLLQSLGGLPTTYDGRCCLI